MLWLGMAMGACGDRDGGSLHDDGRNALSGTIGAEGGALRGAAGTPLAGVSLVVPSGAFALPTELSLSRVALETPLPPHAASVGHAVSVEMSGVASRPVRLTVPFDPTAVAAYDQDYRFVKVWRRVAAGWRLTEPVAATTANITIEATVGTVFSPGVRTVE